ncbi:uncharacterized protein TNCV_3491751 [Trichonephila clavipes]|nr:uncharacterized protein TNCV_3491751 [Trichonephila clavipes]
MLNDDEIVTSMQEESDPVDDETDEDEYNNSNERWQDSIKCVSCVRDSYGVCPVSYTTWIAHSVFVYPNNRVSERCSVPIDSDKRRSTVK